MSQGKVWDLTSTNSLQAAAGWLRKKAGEDCLFVLIVRVDDLAISADPKLMPHDLAGLIVDRAPEFQQVLLAEREERLAVIDRKNERKARKTNA